MERKNFPLLRVKFPVEEEMPKFRHENPHLWMEAMKLRNLGMKISGIPSRREREEALSEMLKRQMGSHPEAGSLSFLNESIRMVDDLFDKFRCVIPRRYAEMFSSEGVIAFSSDYLELISNWHEFELKRQDGDELARIREFAARRLLCLAMMNFQIRLIYETGDQSRDCAQITRHLENVFFERKLSNKVVLSWHDPKNKERVKKWCFKGEENPTDTDGLILKETNLKCRSVSWEGKEFPVFFDSRLKKDPEKLRKMLQKDIPDPRLANTDEYGLRFIFFSKEAMEECLLKLCLEVWPLPFMTWKISDNTGDGEALNGAERSKHSSRSFRALKFKTATFGFWPEVIVQRIEDFLNHKCSRGPEAHSLYRANQLREEIFPLVFPEAVYGVDWSEKEVAETMEEDALSDID